MAYTLLIADDEPLERDALSTIAHQSAPGSPDILVAASGTEAVQLARDHRIDAALLDIKMPGLNGLEAAAKIQEIHPQVRIVFLSAFDYFEYAQRAIRLKAFDYLVKPVDDEAVERVIHRVAEAIGRSEFADVRLQEAHRFLESEVFDDIIVGETDKEIVRTAFHVLEIEEKPGFAIVFRPLFERYAFPLETAVQRRTLVLRFLRNLRGDLKDLVGDILIRAHPDNGYALVLGTKELDMSQLSGLLRLVGERIACPGSAALLRHDGTATDISRAITLARNCVTRVSADPGDSVIVLDGCTKMVPDGSYPTPDAVVQQEQEILTAIIERDGRRVRNAASELWRAIAASSREEELAGRISSVVNYLMHAVQLREHTTYPVPETQILEPGASLQVIKSRFIDALLILNDRPDDALGDPLARRMHGFIAEHFASPIGLADLAEYCALSESHCSRSFTRLFGKAFTRYLNEYRIHRAKLLLIDSDRAIGDISATVGFRDPAYFSRVFLRLEGIRPVEYRENYSF